MKNIRVSIVEDDPRIVALFVDWLNGSNGFICSGSHHSSELAFKNLANELPEVVLMDINLPGLSGVECVRQMKPVLPNTQFIMVTVYEDSEHIFAALSAGASGYLLKKTPKDELLQSIKSVFAGGSPMTGSIARKVVRHFHKPALAGIQEHNLSPRENQILGLLTQGYLYKEISGQLGISIATVNCHIRNIYEKMHVRSRAQAVAKYTQVEGVASSR